MHMRATTCLLATSLLACGTAEAEWAGSVESLPNGGERVRNPAEGLWGEGEAWRLEPTLRVGRVEGEAPDVFGRVAAIEVHDGRLYVLDGQAREVRVFDASGAHVHTFGRPGEGPGELGSPSGLVFDAAGRLWIPDGANARYAQYDETGAVLEYRPRQSAALFFGEFRGGIDERGRLWDVDLVRGSSPGVSSLMAGAGVPGGGREILRAMFSLDSTEAAAGAPAVAAGVHAADGAADTVWIPEATNVPEPFTVDHDRGRSFLGVPFTPRVHFTFDPRGFVWFGESGEYRIVQQALSNDTVRVIERAHTPLPVTAGDINEWLEGAARFTEQGGRIDRSRIPATKPVFDGIIIGEDGELWVRLVSDGDDTVFDVFDPEGRYLGPVTAGPGVARSPIPIVREGALWLVIRDALDVSYLTRMRIVKP